VNNPAALRRAAQERLAEAAELLLRADAIEDGRHAASGATTAHTLTTKQAEFIADRKASTLYRWARLAPEVGWKAAGRWHFDERALRTFMLTSAAHDGENGEEMAILAKDSSLDQVHDRETMGETNYE
jgi:hypothetical protein